MSQLMGAFPIVRKLGEGGMGRIYLVRDDADGSLWAAKQFKGDITRPLFVQRFRREFRALKSLDHPAIVKVRHMDYSSERMFFLMEYVAGRSLDRVLVQPRELNAQWINQVLQWIHYLCDPLEYIHQQRMVHRDLKPGNIMILGNNSDVPLKLLDFGVIHWRHADTITTASPTFLGSLRYMAPEQMSEQDIDLRADIYSLGIILYEAIAGRPPFLIDNPLLLMSMHQSSEPPPLTQYNEYVTDNLQNLVSAMLAKRPDDRPGRAQEVKNWISQILQGSEYAPPDHRASVFMTGMLYSPDICGRETQLHTILSEYRHSQIGQVSAITISGETGIGKSRLIKQVLKHSDISQNVVFHGEFQKAGAIHNGILYALKRGRATIRNKLMLQSDEDSLLKNQLISNLDELIQKLEGPLEPSSPSMDLKAISAQILSFFRSTSQNQPIILVLDDLHEAKPGDIGLIRHLIHLFSILDPCEHSLFIILGYRHDKKTMPFSLKELLNWLDERNYRTPIELKPLSKIAVHQMVSSLLGGTSSAPLAATIYEESNGNPLHVIEILRDLIENQPEPIWPTIDSDEPTLAVASSKRITQIMGRRVDRFAEDARVVLHAGAVLGKYFRADELEDVCNIDDNQFLDQVDALLRQRIIEEDPFQPETYRFSHSKLQEAIYQRIPTDERLGLHHKALKTLENIHYEDYGRVSQRLLIHCRECGLRKKEFDYLLIASKYFDSMGDQIEARKLIEDASNLLQILPLKEDEIVEQEFTINVLLGSLLRRTGDVDSAEKLLQHTQTLAVEYDNNLVEAQALKQLGAIWGAQGKIKKAEPALTRALSLFDILDKNDEMIDCYINIGASYNVVSEFGKNLEYLRLAMEKAQLEGDNRRLAMAMINIGIHYASQYQGKDALPYFNRALILVSELDDMKLRSYALMGLASSYLDDDLIDDNVGKVIDLANQTLDLSQKTGDTGLILDSLFKRSIAKDHLGIPVEQDLDKAINLAEKLGQIHYIKNVEDFRQSILNDDSGS